MDVMETTKPTLNATIKYLERFALRLSIKPPFRYLSPLTTRIAKTGDFIVMPYFIDHSSLYCMDNVNTSEGRI